MKEQLALKYSGPAVDDGQMDAYEAAAGIIAFADFIAIAARAAYGEQAKIKTEVRAFEHGSFRVQFALDFGGILATLFSGVASPKDMYELIRQSFEAWKHLQGENPTSTTMLQDGSIQLENTHGQVSIFRAETINIITNPDAANAAQRFAAKPLSQGMDSVSISHGNEQIADANTSDASYIGVLIARETLTENLITQWVLLESPVFRDGNKWRFSDGSTSFWADVEDRDFLDQVESGRRFGKGDRMLVEMRLRQSGTITSLKQERSVVRVIDHKPPATQQPLGI